MPAAVPAVLGAFGGSGALGGIVGSVVSSVAGSALSSVMGAGGPGGGLAGIIGSFTNAFGGLLGQTAGQHMMPTSQYPQPFSPFGMQPQIFNDPFSILRNVAGSMQGLQQGLQSILNDFFGGRGGQVGGGGSFPSIGGGQSAGAGIGNINALKAEAKQMAESGDLQGMLDVQEKMAKLQNAFSLASQMISIEASMVSKAIAGMKVS